MRVDEVSGGLWAVVGMCDDMTGAAVMVCGGEVVTDKLVPEDKVEFVVLVRGGKRVEVSVFQGNKRNQATHDHNTSSKGATGSIFPPTMMILFPLVTKMVLLLVTPSPLLLNIWSLQEKER